MTLAKHNDMIEQFPSGGMRGGRVFAAAGFYRAEAVDASPHEALLPPPDHGLALASLTHDRRCPKVTGSQQHAPTAPGVLLLAIAMGYHRLQPGAGGSADYGDDPFAHTQDLHAGQLGGILKGSTPTPHPDPLPRGERECEVNHAVIIAVDTFAQ